MSLTTISGCNAADGQAVVSVTSYGAICVEAVENQNEFFFNLPSAGTWFKNNWYVIFVVALVVVFCILAIALQCVRWYRRIKHRHLREERDKRVNGMVRLVSSSFRVVSSARQQQQQQQQQQGESRHVASVKSTSTSSSTSSSSDDPHSGYNNSNTVNSPSQSVESSEADETSTMVHKSHRHRRHH